MRYLMISLVTFLMTSCGEAYKKASFLNEYEQFVEEVAKNGKTYDEKKWAETEARFQEYTEATYPKYKDHFSPEEKTLYNTLTGRYYALLAKHEASTISRELEGLLEQTKGVLDELQK